MGHAKNGEFVEGVRVRGSKSPPIALKRSTFLGPDYRPPYTLVLPSWYNNSGKHTFQYRGALKWNTLLSDVRSNLTTMNLNIFKSCLSIN